MRKAALIALIGIFLTPICHIFPHNACAEPACVVKTLQAASDFIKVPIEANGRTGAIAFSKIPGGLRLSDSWAGYEIQAIYLLPNGKRQKINGIILDDGRFSHPSDYSKMGTPSYGGSGKSYFHVLTREEGRPNQVLRVENFVSLKVRKASLEIDYYPGGDFLEKALNEEGKLKVLARLRYATSDQPTFIYGTLSSRDLGAGYRVYSLTDAAGKEHLLDPRLLADDYQSFLLPWRSTKDATYHGLMDTMFDGVPVPTTQIRNVTRDFETKKALIDQAVETRQYLFFPGIDEYFLRYPAEVDTVMKRWYPPEFAERLAVLQKEIGDRFRHLALDPRILCRFDDFISYAKRHLANQPQASAKSLREEYAKSLGSARVFRGMGFNSRAIAEKMRLEGIKAPGLAFNTTDKVKEMLFREFDSVTPNKFVTAEHAQGLFSDLVARRSGDKLQTSMTMSISDYLEVAASVGFRYTDRQFINGAKLFLFEIEMPVFNIIRKTGAFAEKPRNKTYKFGDKVIDGMDPGVEAFVPYEIKPEWIKAIHEYDDPPPGWQVFEP